MYVENLAAPNPGLIFKHKSAETMAGGKRSGPPSSAKKAAPKKKKRSLYADDHLRAHVCVCLFDLLTTTKINATSPANRQNKKHECNYRSTDGALRRS